jgi:hypothetical protein
MHAGEPNSLSVSIYGMGPVVGDSDGGLAALNWMVSRRTNRSRAITSSLSSMP